MSDFRRLMEGGEGDPAAQLLRSARADQAPNGAKDRARARLGLMTQKSVESVGGKDSTELFLRHVRRKRPVSVSTPVLFQNVISPVAPIRHGKIGGMIAAGVQVAVLVAALFVRPVMPVNMTSPVSEVHQDEPEIVFLLPGQDRSTASSVKSTVATVDEQKPAIRKEGFGRVNRSVATNPPATRLPTELVVGEEQASALSEAMAEPAGDAVTDNVAAARGVMPPSGKALPFAADMTRPVRIDGRDPAYTQAALVARVQGTVVMKCVITDMGLAKDCLILKGLPHLDDSVLAAARTWRFSPAMLKGRPVSAQYVFRFHFKRP